MWVVGSRDIESLYPTTDFVCDCSRVRMEDLNIKDRNNRYQAHLPPMHKQIVAICEMIRDLGMTPKKFIYNFLTNNEMVVRERRGKWATEDGWQSTKELLLTIGHLIKADKTGFKRWSHEFILDEVRLNLDLLIHLLT